MITGRGETPATMRGRPNPDGVTERSVAPSGLMLLSAFTGVLAPLHYASVSYRRRASPLPVFLQPFGLHPHRSQIFVEPTRRTAATQQENYSVLAGVRESANFCPLRTQSPLRADCESAQGELTVRTERTVRGGGGFARAVRRACL